MTVKVSNFPLGSRDVAMLAEAVIEDVAADAASAALAEGLVVLQPADADYLVTAGPAVTNGAGGFLVRSGKDYTFLVREGDKIGVSAA